MAEHDRSAHAERQALLKVLLQWGKKWPERCQRLFVCDSVASCWSQQRLLEKPLRSLFFIQSGSVCDRPKP